MLKSGAILEIGSGPYGIGTFRKVPFTGCDLAFLDEPKWPMTPLIASAADLPLADQSFDVVLASDVLEHVPPELRKAVIQEALRVARRLVIFGFPCGVIAHELDEELREIFLTRNLHVPIWLEEHMEAAFPEPSLFEGIPGWNVDQRSNESIRFHRWLMRSEMNKNFVRVTARIVRYAPWLVTPLLRWCDGEPSYRKIFVLSKATG
jgi:SAM-dependent methyltransferase